MSRLARVFYSIVAVAPVLVAFVLVQAVEPFPHEWLSSANTYFAANILRAVTFFFSGGILGMLSVTSVTVAHAERVITSGNARKLYWRIFLVSLGTEFLIATLLFYVRERVNLPLSPATPVALGGLFLLFMGLALTISYQRSRVRVFHGARQIIGVVESAATGDHDLCIRAVGVTDPVVLQRWLDDLREGARVRIWVEDSGEVSL